jgi:clan AA aspartic protease
VSIRVAATVRSFADPDRFWKGLFLVDTGAVDCLVPGRHLRELGIRSAGKRSYELADGTEVTFEIGGAQIEFMGETVWVTVLFGADDAEPILGVTALSASRSTCEPSGSTGSPPSV